MPAPSATQTGFCEFKTSIWGVALWNGLVWGTDGDGNRIFALNQSTQSFQNFSVPGSDGFPYSLSVGSDNALWFTLLSTPPRLGRIDTQGQVNVYSIPADAKDIPADISFVNSTTAYFVGIEPQAGNGSVYWFNPSQTSSVVSAVRLGGNFNLYSPNSLSAANSGVWVTQHGAASVALYQFSSRVWRVFPTSTENYTSTTLPYFVKANGSGVWFNEHYGNRMAFIDLASSKMTEYSVSNPPVDNGSRIGNALTIALAGDRLWFAEVTANDLGFVDARYQPNFSVQSGSGATVALAKGGTQTLTVDLSGTSKIPLRVQFSDSEGTTSIPKGISISSSSTSFSSLSSPIEFSVTIRASTSLATGTYTVVVTVTDGLVSRSLLFQVTVH